MHMIREKMSLLKGVELREPPPWMNISSLHIDPTHIYTRRYMQHIPACACLRPLMPTHMLIHACTSVHVWSYKQPQRTPRSRSQGLRITESKPDWTRSKSKHWLEAVGRGMHPSVCLRWPLPQDATVLFYMISEMQVQASYLSCLKKKQGWHMSI